MLRYRSTPTDTGSYYYAHNTRGDIIGLYDNDGNLYAKNSYDVWGKLISVTNASGGTIADPTSFANIQPLRYRGYYFDTETGFYSLQSRYYDPVAHRFINADDVDISELSGSNVIIKTYVLFAPLGAGLSEEIIMIFGVMT